MSNDVFPSLPGLAWDIVKAPEFSTGVQRSVNLSELRVSYASAPVWHFTLTFEVLREDTVNSEMQTLMGFFLAHYGRYDSWLYAADDGIVSAQRFGTGNGSATQFQLIRSMGAFNEPVANANLSQVAVSNVATSNYTLAANGVVTFTSPPAANAPLTWSGTLYYRCRFEEDTVEFNEFMRNLWEAQSVKFVGSLGQAI